MRRRCLLLATGATSAASALWCSLGLAQSKERPARIAYIAERGAPNEFEQAFLRGLRERGFVEGTQLFVDFRWAGGDAERLKMLAGEALAAAPVLVVATDAASVRTVRTLDNSIAIVHPVMGDPVASGYASNLARPDRNVTGLSVLATELGAKRVELLKEAVPGLQRVGVLVNAARAPQFGAATRAAAEALGLSVVEMRLDMPDGIEPGFATAVRQGVQAIIVVSDTSTITHRAPLCAAALKQRLPTVFPNRTYLRAGGLISYGADLEAAFHRAAYYVERLLKGARPVDLPIEQPTTFQLVLSQRTARLMNFKFPQALLLRADEVIQ